jgi:hypothetical protein
MWGYPTAAPGLVSTYTANPRAYAGGYISSAPPALHAAAEFIKPLYQVAAVWRRLSVLSANNPPGAKSRENVVLCSAIAIGSALQPDRLQRLTSSSSAPPRSETAHQSQVTRVSDVMGEAVG